MRFFKTTSEKVPFWAHPNLTVLVSTIGLISGVLAVLLASQFPSSGMEELGGLGKILELLPRAPWISLAVGIVVGLGTMFVQKRLLRSRIQFYADFFTIPVLDRLRWRVVRINIPACLPMAFGPLLAVGVACSLQISPWPAFFGPGICYFLAYPEQKLIYEAAKSHIARRGNMKFHPFDHIDL